MIIKSFEVEKIKSIRSDLILIYGSNQGHKSQVIKELFEKSFKGEIFRFDENEILNNYEEFISSLINKSLFDDFRLIIISRASEKIIKLINEIVERNIEKMTGMRVYDRTALILYIFSLRAKSYEGKLQVELAHLDHLSSRLIKGWSHLERQKGGIGVRGGPGEKQIELDRRMLGLRIKQLKEKLRKLGQQRGMQRRARKRSKALSVSIVGYTNAGKSTLFNRLTHESIYAEDKLFATLDTTSRKLFVQPGHSFVISDTVGFIKNLPTTLIEAFKSTLEEVTQSNLLIHVVDVSNENRSEQIKEVEKILREIEAHELPQILVLNQIDKINIKTSCERDDYGKINHIQLSAKTGDGIEFLKQAMVEYNQTQINQRNGYYA